MKSPSGPAWRDKVFAGLLLVWVGLVFSHYFSLKTAFDLSFLSTAFSVLSRADLHKLADNWLNFLKNLFCAVSVLFVLWRLGRKALLWIGLQVKGTAPRFCLETALGIIAINTLWLGLGLNRLWFEPLEWGLGLALFGGSLWEFSRNFLKIQKFPRVPKPGKFFLLLGFLGGLSLALDLLQGMTPDVYFDALVYHLATLQFWQFHHGIADFYTNLYSYFPFGGELYFANGFFFAGSEAAKMLNAFSAGLCGLAAAGWVAEETGWDKGLLAWTMVLTLPLVSAAVWTTQNDVVLAFFLILFLYTLMRWVQGPANHAWALAAGLLGGAALTVKYTAVVSIGIGLLTTLVFYIKDVASPKKGAGWVWVILLVVCSITPWVLKNSVFTGNAFYPYLSSVFGGRALPDENMKSLLGDNEVALGKAFSLWHWLGRVLAADLNKTIAPLLFAFAPFLFLGGKRRPVTRFLLVLSAILLLSGFLISHQLRLMIPTFAVCFLAMVLVLGDAEKKGAVYAWGGIVAIFAALGLLSLGRLSVDYYQTPEMALGAETREEYLGQAAQTSTYYGLTQAVQNRLPPDARILVAGDSRGLYYSRSFYANSVFDDQVLTRLIQDEKNGDGIYKKLREMGIDAIAFSGDEALRLAQQYPFDFPGPPGAWGEFIQRWIDPLYVNGSQGLYLIRKIPAGPRKPIPGFGVFVNTDQG